MLFLELENYAILTVRTKKGIISLKPFLKVFIDTLSIEVEIFNDMDRN